MDKTPEDARNTFAALLNHVPPTMPATQSVLQLLLALRSVRQNDGDVSLEELTKLIGKVAATVAVAVATVEQRLEETDGRPGIGDSTWEAILTEFNFG